MCANQQPSVPAEAVRKQAETDSDSVNGEKYLELLINICGRPQVSVDAIKPVTAGEKLHLCDKLAESSWSEC